MKSPSRQRLTAKIHIARKELAMDEETYRLMLEECTGKNSTADMSEDELHTVMDRLHHAGFVGKTKNQRVAKHPGTPHNISHVARLQKIEAQLASMGLPWSYADSIAKRITGGRGYEHGGHGIKHAEPGVERLAWVKKSEDLDAVIAALHVEQEKRNLQEMLGELLKEKGKTRDDLGKLFKLRPNWERHRLTLKAIVEHLREIEI